MAAETREERTDDVVNSTEYELESLVRNTPDNLTVTIRELNRVVTTTAVDTIDIETEEVLSSVELDPVIVDTLTGRRWSEPFSGEDADLPGLKQRFHAGVVASNQMAVQDAALETKIINYLASL
jgi:hypothetical protein